MHWINFHIKHTAASQCVLHLAVWTMSSTQFFPHTHSCAYTERKMGIIGWVWLLVPRVCGYHGNGEEKLKVVENVYLKADVWESWKAVRVLFDSGVCVLWSNGPGWVRCALVKGEVSRECVGGGDVVKIVEISKKSR